jgi:hypothetical protein
MTTRVYPASPLPRFAGLATLPASVREDFMNVVIAALYGLIVWLSLLAFAVIVRAEWHLVIWWGPVIVCAAMVFLWVADYVVWRAITALSARWFGRS